MKSNKNKNNNNKYNNKMIYYYISTNNKINKAAKLKCLHHLDDKILKYKA